VTSVLAVYGISRKDDKETRKPDKKFIVESKDQTPPTK
jgi:hypothetical protein